jgi:ATP-dependent Clp protease, protease subunit
MTTHYVSFSAEIMPQPTEQLIAAMATLTNQGATEIHLMLSTVGGSVMHGITIYNTLRALPVRIVTHNVGNVDSIGNVIFLAGAERYACPNSTFMFHGVGRDVQAGMRLEDKVLREAIDSIEADHRRIGAIIGQHTSLNETQVVELFAEARTKDACWAEQIGMIDAIREPQIPAGVPIHSLVFAR